MSPKQFGITTAYISNYFCWCIVSYAHAAFLARISLAKETSDRNETYGYNNSYNDIVTTVEMRRKHFPYWRKRVYLSLFHCIIII